MIEFNRSTLEIAGDDAADANASELSFAGHMERCELFCDEINRILQTRFRKCEAVADVTWEGQVQLRRTEMTNVAGPKGPIKIGTLMLMPLLWTLKDNDSTATTEEQLNEALMKMEQSARQQCANMKALRMSFPAYAKAMSSIVATAKPTPSRIITP